MLHIYCYSNYYTYKYYIILYSYLHEKFSVCIIIVCYNTLATIIYAGHTRYALHVQVYIVRYTIVETSAVHSLREYTMFILLTKVPVLPTPSSLQESVSDVTGRDLLKES